MISSNLLLERTSTPEIRLKETNINECFFTSGIEFLKEINSDFDNANKILYHSLSESTEYTVVTESFSDFTDTVKKIITKFINFIKSIFKRFLAQLHKIVGSDKYITKHKDEFRKFGINHEFDMDLFTFTIEDHIPNLTAYDDYMSDMGDNMQRNFDTIKDGLSGDDSVKQTDYTKHILQKIYKDTVDLHDNSWYDNFRGKVLGGSYPVSNSDYASELFALFRNGESTKETKHVDSMVVNDALHTFTNFEKVKNTTETNLRRLEREYSDIKKNINKINGNIIDGTNISINNQEERINAEQFFKAKANQIETMCNIHTLAFTAKLDAIKDRCSQDKSLLYKALNKIYKGDK